MVEAKGEERKNLYQGDEGKKRQWLTTYWLIEDWAAENAAVEGQKVI